MKRAAPSPICITGGRVVDPTSGATRVRELYLAGGSVCEPPPAGQVRTIDATGQIVMAGAIDMHTHIASMGVAMARRQNAELAPMPADTADAYCQMGYTTVIDAAVPVEEVDLAHNALDAMSNVDTGFLLAVGLHRPLIEALDKQGKEAAIGVLEDLIEWSGAFGIKLVNPGLTDSLDTFIPHTHVPARQLIEVCTEAADRLELSHGLHVHAPRLGMPGNVASTLDMLQALGRRRVHLAHAQFASYDADDSRQYTSGVARLLEYVHAHENVTLDTGCISFGPAITVSLDRLLVSRLTEMMNTKPHEHDGWSVMPMQYCRDNPVNALQWAMGLELCLAGVETGRVAMSVDHPNGGSFKRMLEILRWLGDSQARARELDAAHAWAGERSTLGSMQGRELDEEALVTLTRIAPAKALGLTGKGHLQPGAMADVVIAPQVWSQPTTVIKCGRVVVENGQVVADAAAKRLTGVEA